MRRELAGRVPHAAHLRIRANADVRAGYLDRHSQGAESLCWAWTKILCILSAPFCSEFLAQAERKSAGFGKTASHHRQAPGFGAARKRLIEPADFLAA